MRESMKIDPGDREYYMLFCGLRLAIYVCKAMTPRCKPPSENEVAIIDLPDIMKRRAGRRHIQK